MGKYEALFNFAAKAGALEGYVYEREKLEPLDNWAANIEKMYAGLTDDIKRDISSEFRYVLTRTISCGEKFLNDEVKARLNNLLLAD